ncbi:MAG: hypothetical protein FD170_2803 [Bacteroidetes bacterium]|nr:MAG: hypothetical protein FD170_2803 [Bacteroidota bacterium]
MTCPQFQAVIVWFPDVENHNPFQDTDLSLGLQK